MAFLKAVVRAPVKFVSRVLLSTIVKSLKIVGEALSPRVRLIRVGLTAAWSARRLPLLFLDLTEEAVILYDRSSFLETTLLELKRRLLKQGAKRVMVGKERWYWDLKPDYRLGEKVELA
jgi:hypothetical protein